MENWTVALRDAAVPLNRGVTEVVLRLWNGPSERGTLIMQERGDLYSAAVTFLLRPCSHMQSFWLKHLEVE